VLAQTALPPESVEAKIRNSVNGMPAYSDAVLSDKDAADICAFVKSLPGPRSAKDIPILKIEASAKACGQSLYRQMSRTQAPFRAPAAPLACGR
jgi:cytochrome c